MRIIHSCYLGPRDHAWGMRSTFPMWIVCFGWRSATGLNRPGKALACSKGIFSKIKLFISSALFVTIRQKKIKHGTPGGPLSRLNCGTMMKAQNLQLNYSCWEVMSEWVTKELIEWWHILIFFPDICMSLEWTKLQNGKFDCGCWMSEWHRSWLNEDIP